MANRKKYSLEAMCTSNTYNIVPVDKSMTELKCNASEMIR